MRRGLIVAAAALAGLAAVGASLGEGRARAERPKELVVGLQVIEHGKAVLALVPVTINGTGPFTFALDTGASQSLIDLQAARRLGVPKVGSAGKIAGVTGVKKAALVKVTRWRVGQIKLPPTTMVRTNMPGGNAYAGLQGLLGSDMLSRFDVITIDYAHKQLRLHPRN
jgi:predicted aspartyl protease